jgi:hypothetical protein
MLTLQLNPIHKGGFGEVVLSGSVNALGVSMVWWWADNPKIKLTKGLQLSGMQWELSAKIGNSTDVVQIQASKNGETSNTITVDLSTRTKKAKPTYQFNEFDELALEVDLDRMPLEDNESLRSRVIKTFTHPGNSTRTGIINGLERTMSLPSMERFFFLSARFDPRTGKAYKNVTLSFKPYECTAQLDSWIKHDELVDLDPTSWTFTTSNPIGNENPELGNVIKIYNGKQQISDTLFKQLDRNTIWLDLNSPRIDASKEIYITYPYNTFFSYITNNNKIKNVVEVKEFLEQVDYVTNEVGEQLPLIIWNDGYFVDFDGTPDTFTLFDSYEQAINDQIRTTFKHVKLKDDAGPYLEYVSDFRNKSVFLATQIVPQLDIRLTHEQVEFRGSWIALNELHDKEYQKLLQIPGTIDTRTLEYYANRLRSATRMGMRNTIVNKDEWGSDEPENIGQNFIPSNFDGGIQGFPITSDGGSILNLTLNQRKQLIRDLAGT